MLLFPRVVGLVLLTLALVLGTVVAEEGAVSSPSTACLVPDLPTDVDLISVVEANSYSEVHLHGMYRVGRDAHNVLRGGLTHELRMEYNEAHEFRLAMSSLDTQTLDLYLFKLPKGQKAVTESDKPVIVSLQQGFDPIERMVGATLQPGYVYIVQVVYTMPTPTAKSCSLVLMELAVQPLRLVKVFSEICEENAGIHPNLGTITPKAEDDYYYKYHSTSERGAFWFPIRESISKDFEVITKYTMKLPRIIGRHQRWKFFASIQSRFLDGGDIAAMVTIGSNVSQVTTKDCENAKFDTMCVYGRRALKNQYIMQSELWSSSLQDVSNTNGAEYTLWLLQRSTDPVQTTCAPYSLELTIFPLKDKETFVNCNIDPLPATFNVPGMYDNDTGLMSFSQDVLVDLTNRSHLVRIRPTKPLSMLRVYVGAHPTIDFDVALFEQTSSTSSGATTWDSKRLDGFAKVASSSRLLGPDGLVYPITNTREYIIEIATPYPVREYQAGREHDYTDFCDSYDLRVDVIPTDDASSSSSDSCSENSPKLAVEHRKLSQGEDVSIDFNDYTKYPYHFPMQPSSSGRYYYQQDVLSWTFPIIKPSQAQFIVPSDPTTGPIVIKLTQKRPGLYGQSSEIVIAYGEPTTLGQKLGVHLKPGNYTLVLQTPPMQRITVDKADAMNLPKCLGYNLRMSVVSGVPKCLGAIPFPDRFPVTSKTHSQIEELFAIEGRSHLMSLDLSHIHGSVLLHILVETSDTPVVITVFGTTPNKKTQKVGTSTSTTLSGVVELFTPLSKGQYDVQFAFSTAAAATSGCRKLKVQMSVVPMPTSPRLAGTSGNTTIAPMQEDLHLPPMTIPFLYGPQPLRFTTSDSTIVEGTTYYAKRMHFSLNGESVLRATTEFEFGYFVVGVNLCRCVGEDEDRSVCSPRYNDECRSALGYFNGVELGPVTLPAGKFTIEFRVYRSMMTTSTATTGNSGGFEGASSVDLLSNVLLFFQLAIHGPQDPFISAYDVTTDSSDSDMGSNDSALCPPQLQYLPSTLNSVAYLWPTYKDETHFMQQLLVPHTHSRDSTAFTLRTESVIRVALPEKNGALFASATLRKVEEDGASSPSSSSTRGRNTFKPIVASTGQSPIFATISPGSYTLELHYSGNLEIGGHIGGRPCRTIPIELSIVPTSALANLTAPAEKCRDKALTAVPSNPHVYHGHDFRYRDPRKPFYHELPFTIQTGGGAVQFDIRYPFITSGLEVIVRGAQWKQYDGYHYADRVVIDRNLPAGSYTLVIKDAATRRRNPVPNNVPCSPYSLHLRTVSYGNSMPPAPTPAPGDGTGSGSGSHSSPATPPPPTTTAIIPNEDPCAYLPYNELPSALTLGNNSGSSSSKNNNYHGGGMMGGVTPRVMLKGKAFRIPYAAGHPVLGGTRQRVTEAAITLPMRPGYMIRVWGRTYASTVMSMSLYSTDGTLVTSSKSFGIHSNSISHLCSGSGNMTLKLLFYYDKEPVEHTDYEGCSERFVLDAYALYVAVFPTSDALTAVKCTPKQLAGDVNTRLPPRSITLDQGGGCRVGGDYFLTASDLRSSSSSSGNDDDTNSAIGGGLQAPTQTKLTTDVIIPPGNHNVTLIVTIRFNFKWLNMRASLHQYISDSSGSSDTAISLNPLPIAISDVAPLKYNDQNANAGLYLVASPYLTGNDYLQPGRYAIITHINYAQSWSENAEFCIDFHFTALAVAGYQTASSGPATPPPPPSPHNGDGGYNTPPPPPAPTAAPQRPAPALLDVTPRSIANIDPSDPLSITLTLNTPSDMQIHESTAGISSLAWLVQDIDVGRPHVVKVESWQFLSASVLVLNFPERSLHWQTEYELRVDGTKLWTSDGRHGYNDDAFSGRDASSYFTAYCSCSKEGFCVGGGGCGCTEANGEECSVCEKGSNMSSDVYAVPLLHIPSRYCLLPGQRAPPKWSNKDNNNNNNGGVATKAPSNTGEKPPQPHDGNNNNNAGGKNSGSTNNNNNNNNDNTKKDNGSVFLHFLRNFFTILVVGGAAVGIAYFVYPILRRRIRRRYALLPGDERPFDMQRVGHNVAEAAHRDDDDDDDDDEDEDTHEGQGLNNNSSSNSGNGRSSGGIEEDFSGNNNPATTV